MPRQTDFTITRLARESGVKRETIRFYEQRGLLPAPPRSAAGYRLYAREEARRVRFIKSAQALGFTLGEVGELLALRGTADCTCGMVKAHAMAKVADIERRIAALAAMKSALLDVAAGCDDAGAPLDECPILSALDTGEKHG